MAHLSDTISDTLKRFACFEGEFEIYSRPPYHTEHVSKGFIPFFTSLTDEDRKGVVRLLGEICLAIEKMSGFSPDLAYEVLFYLQLPWPVDFRRTLLVVKDHFLYEFRSRQNLERWAAWPEGDFPRRAIEIYSLLLVISTDDELKESVEILNEKSVSTKFKKKLNQRPLVKEGIRLCSIHQLTREEYDRHFLAVQREGKK